MKELQNGFYVTKEIWSGSESPIIRYDLSHEGFEEAYSSEISPIIMVQDNKVVTYRRPDMINWEREDERYNDMVPMTFAGTVNHEVYSQDTTDGYNQFHEQECNRYEKFLKSKVQGE